jgi:hypothetical protein
MSTEKINLSTANQAMAQFQKSKQVQNQSSTKGADERVLMEKINDRSSPELIEDHFELSSAADKFETTTQLHAAGKQAVADLPEVREERLLEVREKMLDNKIITPEVREKVSANLSKVMELLDLFVD